MSDGDLRMLGASDGYASALAHLRCNVLPSMTRDAALIPPSHFKKAARHAERLAPLLSLEKWLAHCHAETFAAYQKTR